MSGRGCYAGQPIAFYCSKCRRSSAFSRVTDGRFTTGHAGTNWRTTGRTRKQLSEGGNFHGWPDTAYQYECLDCGHKGWSRHPVVHRRYQKEWPDSGEADA